MSMHRINVKTSNPPGNPLMHTSPVDLWIHQYRYSKLRRSLIRTLYLNFLYLCTPKLNLHSKASNLKYNGFHSKQYLQTQDYFGECFNIIITLHHVLLTRWPGFIECKWYVTSWAKITVWQEKRHNWLKKCTDTKQISAKIHHSNIL